MCARSSTWQQWCEVCRSIPAIPLWAAQRQPLAAAAPFCRRPWRRGLLLAVAFLSPPPFLPGLGTAPGTAAGATPPPRTPCRSGGVARAHIGEAGVHAQRQVAGQRPIQATPCSVRGLCLGANVDANGVSHTFPLWEHTCNRAIWRMQQQKMQTIRPSDESISKKRRFLRHDSPGRGGPGDEAGVIRVVINGEGHLRPKRHTQPLASFAARVTGHAAEHTPHQDGGRCHWRCIHAGACIV